MSQGGFRNYPEDKYKTILSVPEFHYQLAERGDPLADAIFPTLSAPFMSACISTAGTTQVTLNYEDFEIPKGSRIAHVRLFREDNSLSKSYDTIIFPIKSGAIISLPWKYTEDHHRPLLLAGLEGIIQAHGLPDKKDGHVSEYTVKGAIIPVVIDFGKQESEKLQKEKG